MATDTAHQTALDRFTLAVDAEKAQRTREEADLAFQIPEQQWPDEIVAMRKAQTVEGIAIPSRPMISVPMLDQPVQLVLNQEKAAKLGVTVHALSEDANDDTAEALAGLYREIERTSRANLARSWAFERAVKAGRGAYRILTEMDPTAPKGTDDQRIVIKRLLHQDAAYFDPFATEPDWSDGEWGFVASWISLKKYKRLHPDSTISDMDTGDLNTLATEQPLWVTGEGEARAILVVEYFEVGAGPKDRFTPNDLVLWRKLNAVEVLSTKPWNGLYVPIVPTIGRELIPVKNERRWTGIYGPNKGAQQLANFSASGAIEMASLESKASHELDPITIENYEAWWNQKNTRNFPYLPRRRFIDGVDYGPATPIQADMSKVQVNLALLDMAKGFIHTGTGAFEPTLGQSSPNARTKGGTLALQAQHDQGNSNWLDNLAEISMTYEAKVILDMIPRVYDRPGRVVRTLGLDGDGTPAMLNAPFVMDPATKRPVPAPPPMPGQPAPDGVKHFDLNAGRYGVTVSIGKAYKRRADEGKDELAALFQAEPQLFSILGDIYLKFADFPGHQEAAERVKKMLPPQLQQPSGEDPVKDLEHAKTLIANLQQQTAQMGKALETDQAKAQAGIATVQAKAQADLERAKLDAEVTLRVKEMELAANAQQAAADREVKLAVAELGAKVDREKLFMEERTRVGIHESTQAAELAESERQRQHDAAQQDQNRRAAAAKKVTKTLNRGADGRVATISEESSEIG